MPRACDGVAPGRCEGVTRAGHRCSITSSSTITDDAGRRLAEPLRRGSKHCRVHLDLFCIEPSFVELDDILIVYFDLETTGLDVTKDQIVEIGAICCDSMAKFATVVRPATTELAMEAQFVHGISPEELRHGPSFRDAFFRMADFLERCADAVLDSDEEESSDGDAYVN